MTKLELVSWKENNNQHTIKSVAGFVIEEGKTVLKIASTRGNRGYLDVFSILRSHIIERKRLYKCQSKSGACVVFHKKNR